VRRNASDSLSKDNIDFGPRWVGRLRFFLRPWEDDDEDVDKKLKRLRFFLRPPLFLRPWEDEDEDDSPSDNCDRDPPDEKPSTCGTAGNDAKSGEELPPNTCGNDDATSPDSGVLADNGLGE